MAYFLSRNKLWTILLSIIFVHSTMPGMPLIAYEKGFLDDFKPQDAIDTYKLEKCIEKLVKLKDCKSANKIIDALLDVKEEAENKLGKSIKLSEHFKQIEVELHKRGYKTPKKEFDVIRKYIEKREKHRKFLVERAGDHGDKVELPLKLVYGVTLSLAGLFLFLVPFPVCQTVGGNVLITGVTVIADFVVEQAAQQNKKRCKAVLQWRG